MHFRALGWTLAVGMYVAASSAAGPPQTGTPESPYRHGYYLFLVGPPRGCEDCYIPLLITKKTLEESKANNTAEDSVLITTYERDSIWHYDGLVRIAQKDISELERKVRVLDRNYRYQEIGAKETLRILENPMGKIPISRIPLPAKLPAGPPLKELIAEFRAVE
jgi:hypothetical protein